MAAPVQRCAAQNHQLTKETTSTEQLPPSDHGPERINEQAEDDTGPANLAHTVTNTNSFGVFREYLTTSSHNPRSPDAFEDALAPTASQNQSIGSGLAVVPSAESVCDPLVDSKNKSEDLLLAWMFTNPGNSPANVNELVHVYLRHPDFDPAELEHFNAITAIRRFEREHFSKSGAMTLKACDGWREASVRIRVPCTGVKQKENEAPEFVVDGILYRDVVEVITAELKDPDAFENIHTTPFKEWWCPRPGDGPVRVYSETYNSDAMLEADKKTREKFGGVVGSDADLETFVISALLYSDSTHLASFGSTSLWPIYLFLGNVSKYTRSKPTSFSAHHITYIPTVCDLTQRDSVIYSDKTR